MLLLRDAPVVVILSSLFLACSAVPLAVDLVTRSCTGTNWRDVLVFFVLNYLAHAVTVPSQPGGKWQENSSWVFLSLLLPFAGLGRAIALVVNHFVNDAEEVKRAMARGVVIVAARLPGWRPPQDREQLVYVKLPAFRKRLALRF